MTTTKGTNDAGFVCLYKGNRIEVYAETSYKAQLKAAQIFKTRKSYDVTVVLAERIDGLTVEHSGSEL